MSEVKRLCIKDIKLDGIVFRKGDIVSVNLVPAKTENKPKKIGFGVGIHICTGKQLANEILSSEQYKNCEINSEPNQEGAFVLYKDK